ncbi:hypothetical protein L1049_018554 [Liquidambar formosana]|uniref:Uncharacterized protein n=1 Tax=Liquidambar formosana TaxID=63359 RepID=A0AAP0WME2_LIQFO
MGSVQTMVCVKQVKQEVQEEWDESMPLPGDIIEGFSEEDAEGLFMPAKGRSEFSSQLGKISRQVETIWVKVRRGDSTLKLQACVVPERCSKLHRRFTFRAASDERHVAVLGDLTLEQCTELQDMSRKVVNVDCRGFNKKGVIYDWKMKVGTYLPDNRSTIVQGIRLWFLPGIAEVSIELTLEPGETRFGMDIKRTEEGFSCIYSVTKGSAAERAGLGRLREEANATGHLVVISRLEGKSLIPSNACSEGLIYCCDHMEIKDTLTSAMDGMDSIVLHIMAWPNPNQTSPRVPQAIGAAILRPPNGYCPPQRS